jgi:hypothetical protein
VIVMAVIFGNPDVQVPLSFIYHLRPLVEKLIPALDHVLAHATLFSHQACVPPMIACHGCCSSTQPLYLPFVLVGSIFELRDIDQLQTCCISIGLYKRNFFSTATYYISKCFPPYNHLVSQPLKISTQNFHTGSLLQPSILG